MRWRACLPACLQAKAQSGFSFVLLLRLDRSLFYLRRDLHYSCEGEEGGKCGACVEERGNTGKSGGGGSTVQTNADKRSVKKEVGNLCRLICQSRRPGGRGKNERQFLLAASDATEKGGSKGAVSGGGTDRQFSDIQFST